MRIWSVMFIVFTLVGCGEDQKETKKIDEELVVIKNNLYTEYYPGKKAVKYQGKQDADKKRDGKWTYYSESGLELSTTMYTHGLKDGLTLVKYPNGILHYTGEYRNDTMVGIWRTYDEKGNMVEEKDYNLE